MILRNLGYGSKKIYAERIYYPNNFNDDFEEKFKI